MKKLNLVFVVLLLVAIFSSCNTTNAQKTTQALVTLELPTQVAPTMTETPQSAESQSIDYLNLTYEIDGSAVTLVNGRSEVEAAPGSSTKILAQYFGNEATGDLNGDGKDDIVFILTQNSGGSGTLFFTVAAVSTENGYIGTNAILLGDRIAPQSTSIEGNIVTIAYADRKPDEPFTVAPSVGVTKQLRVVDNQLVEVTKP